MTCCFLTTSRLFINLFHNGSLTHYHFIYNTDSRRIEGSPQSVVLECSKKNFPYRCFFNDERNEVYSFYRQGQSFMVDADDASKFSLERMTDQDLGQMFLIYNTALIARSSSSILFFKVEKELETEVRRWKQYDELHIRGLIYYIKGNVRIQVTTDDKICFYLIDKETFKPTLENVMYNYMQCNQMLFGSRVRYCLTFKNNQRNFEVFKRAYYHDFKVPVQSENLEGSIGLELMS